MLLEGPWPCVGENRRYPRPTWQARASRAAKTSDLREENQNGFLLSNLCPCPQLSRQDGGLPAEGWQLLKDAVIAPAVSEVWLGSQYTA